MPTKIYSDHELEIGVQRIVRLERYSRLDEPGKRKQKNVAQIVAIVEEKINDDNKED